MIEFWLCIYPQDSTSEPVREFFLTHYIFHVDFLKFQILPLYTDKIKALFKNKH